MMKVKAKEHWEKLKDFPEITPDDLLNLYTNIWGELVAKSENNKYILIKNPDKKVNRISIGGHAFPGGFFNIDEQGIEMYGSENYDEYMRIGNAIKLMDKVNESFSNSDFTLEIGPNNSVSIDDISIVPNCYWETPKNIDDFDSIVNDIVQKVKEFVFNPCNN